MLQPRLLTPLRALRGAIIRSTTPVTRSLPQLPTSQSLLPRTTSAIQSTQPPIVLNPLLSFSQIRHASHSAQGAANKHSRDPAGKRLGAKRTGGEYVVPGCIIFRQRGTKWFPGENCAMGRDHTIYAAQAGYVRYYLDPERHPDRKYIGVVFEKEGKLPTPRNAPTRRRLNRVAVPRLPEAPVEEVQPDLTVVVGEETGSMVGSVAAVDAGAGKQLRPGYMWREANWQIGRAAEKAGITAAPYDRRDRWLAWRKRQAKAQRAAQLKSLKNKKKASKKAKR
ncbi:mitochondrial 54S ribosomal protein bL27m [Aspergillus lucknowensis]|uniref:Large ribosomal subunit protein bL27m n=1 Tax=Aspergillus lucknowensis TaxID=176173 RepID=A0ABR4LG07_9EURO